MRFVIIIFHFFLNNCNGSERDVFLHIFEKYDRRIRPVLNTSTTTVVGIQPQIINLLEVNSQQEYIKLAIFFKEIWNDEFLTWNPADFGGTEYIRAPVSMVWLPDLSVVTTSLQSEDFIQKDEQLLGIHYSGAIDYSFPFVLTNYCPMQSTDFPFDSQTCIIKVTSWKYTSKFIFLEHIFMNNTGARNPSTAWEIQPYTNKSIDFFREGVGEDGVYRQVHYYLTLKRKSTYYIWVIIVPTFIITALSIAGIFSPFSNSGDREEKTTLGLTTLLTLAIILSLVSEAMPKGTELPKLGRYILIQLVICTVSMAASVATLFLHQRSLTRGWKVPPRLFKIACLGKRNNSSADHRDDWTPNSDSIESYAEKSEAPRRNSLHNKLDAALQVIHRWMQKHDDEELRKEQWLILFDQSDVFCFALFECINMISFAVTVM